MTLEQLKALIHKAQARVLADVYCRPIPQIEYTALLVIPAAIALIEQMAEELLAAHDELYDMSLCQEHNEKTLAYQQKYIVPINQAIAAYEAFKKNVGGE